MSRRAASLAAALALAACLGCSPPEGPGGDGLPPPGTPYAPGTAGSGMGPPPGGLRVPQGESLPTAPLRFPDGTVIMAEVAATPAARMRGLMFRTSLDPDGGMLFVFPRAGVHQFWMKNTFVDLDMVFLNDEKAITVVHRNVPRSSPGATEDQLARRSGFGRYVLELPAGGAGRRGLKEGQRLSFDAEE